MHQRILRAGFHEAARAQHAAVAAAARRAAGLKKLASSVANRPATAAVLLSAGPPASIVISRSQDLAFDAGAVMKQLLEQFGGKGGGRGSMAQGGGLNAEPHVILEAARDLISRQSQVDSR